VTFGLLVSPFAPAPAAANDLDALNRQAAELYRASRYAEGVVIAERAVALAVEQHGEMAPEHATALNGLARLYRASGRYGEAEQLYKKALDIVTKILGPDDLQVAASLNGLGWVHRAQGRLGEADEILTRALGLRELALGPEHPDVAESLTTLALVRYDQGRYAEVETLLKRSLAIREKAFGSEHADVGQNLHGLGELYRAWGGHGAEAERYLKLSLDVRERALGPQHYDVGESLHNLALFYAGKGNDADAEPLYRRALAIIEKVLGPEHPDVGHVATSLANVFRRLGRREEALSLLRRSLAIREKTLGPEHPVLAHSLNGLGWAYIDYGRYGEAEGAFKRALALREKNYGPDHPYVSWDHRSLGWSLAMQGRHAESEAELKRAIAIDARGEESSSTATSLSLLGSVYVSQGRYDEAEPVLKRALAIREKHNGPHHKWVAASLVQLAEVYRLLGRPEEAEPLFRRALAIRKAEISEVPVLFATDRQLDRNAKTTAFNGERSEDVTFGVASVLVPNVSATQQTGALGPAPGADASGRFDPETTNMSRLAIRQIDLLPEAQQLVAMARQKLATSNTFSGQVFVFVHGYNVSFENAVRRTAQIAYDLSFDSVPFLFSWPSRNSMWSYWYDRDSAALAVNHLKEFLERVVTQTHAAKVHLIAHSMGNAVLLDALEKISMSSNANATWPLAEIVLHAPDVDRDRFNQLMKATRVLDAKVTLYSSANDKALSFSSWLWGVVGRAGGTPLVVRGVETIDITAAGSSFLGLNHDVYVTNPAIFDDMRLILERGTHPPDLRSHAFRPVPTDKGTYWVFGQPR
jgi:esterase/lipase superfamily enzyme/Tfp pilus assembly protein PilF